MPNPRITPASHLQTDAAPDFNLFTLKLLAQGDSWFSINGLSLFTASSILMRSRFTADTIVVNCADPADLLKHMVDWRNDPFFFRYLAAGSNFEEKWDGLLISGGGNDLIDALGVLPQDAHGVPRMQAERLLLTPSERAATGSIERYVSQDGWAVFRAHMLEQYRALETLRATSARNQGIPIFTHCYAYAQPRNVGAGPLGPWLHPALLAYDVPPEDWLALTRHFIDLLHDEVITRSSLANLHILDTRALIPPASPNPGVKDPNWLNEIHPTAKGYDLIAPAFVKMIEDILLPTGSPIPSPAPVFPGSTLHGG
ncbi:hypothetical protein ACIP1U_23940 [Cupriavidus sp. NPDC089707]|uniref:hypothetical protein n=1 Tax=Cupriavidus sp. NPDC089707 TaxID=3363963 RepID=UPI0037FEBDD5